MQTTHKKKWGFTIIEMMIVLVILSTVVLLVSPSYIRVTRTVRLQEAKIALIQNAKFLDRYYFQKKTYKKTSTTWPKLPIKETDFFNIQFTGVARGVLPNRFRLRAVAKEHYDESRYITLDQDSILLLCEKIKNSTRCKPY